MSIFFFVLKFFLFEVFFFYKKVFENFWNFNYECTNIDQRAKNPKNQGSKKNYH